VQGVSHCMVESKPRLLVVGSSPYLRRAIHSKRHMHRGRKVQVERSGSGCMVSIAPILTNPPQIKTRDADLLEPPFLQLLPLHHRFSNSNGSSQPPNRQHKLNLVKALAQDIERVRWVYSAPKQIESIGENQRSRLQESGRGDYLSNVRDLNR